MLLIVVLGLAPMVLVILGAAIVEAIDHVREIRRHARILSDLGTPLAPTAAFGVAKGQVVTLEGTLVSVTSADDGGPGADRDHANAASKARLVSFHPYGTSFLDEVNVYAITHSSAPKSFALDLDGGAGRVLIGGPAQVLRGTIETEHTAPLEKAIALDAEPLGRAKVKVKKRIGQFRVVKPGDRARARGAVEPAPDDDALYRARSNVLRMTPAGPIEAEDGVGEPKIGIATTTTRRRRMQSRRGVGVAAFASAIIGGVLAAGALRADLPARMQRSTSTKSGASASAGAGPSQVVEPPCRAVVLAKLSKYDVSDPKARAASCDDAYARAMADYASGDFAAASKGFTAAVAKDPNLVPSLTEVETHLFVHSFDEAANVIRRMNAQFYPGPSTEEKRHLECILDVVAQRAQKKAANGVGVGAGAGDGDGDGDRVPRFVKVCSTRAFLKLAPELDSMGAYRGEDDWPRPTYRHDTRYDAVNQPFTAVVATRARLTARPVGLERDLVDRLLLKGSGSERTFGNLELHFEYDAPELFPILATFAAELTLFYAYAGFPERSAPYWPILDRVADALEANRSFYRVSAGSTFEGEKKRVEDEHVLLNHVMSIAGAAALYSNDLVRMKRYTGVGEPYSSQASRQMARVVLPSNPWEDPVVDRAWPEHKAVFDAAQTGSAAEVARILTEQRSTGRTTLPRALALLGSKSDRSPLDRWFHSDTFPAACLTCGASTFLGDISDRREIARLLGDASGERDRLRTNAERFTTALTDPEIGFEIDELETFFSKRK